TRRATPRGGAPRLSSEPHDPGHPAHAFVGEAADVVVGASHLQLAQLGGRLVLRVADLDADPVARAGADVAEGGGADREGAIEAQLLDQLLALLGDEPLEGSA